MAVTATTTTTATASTGGGATGSGHGAGWAVADRGVTGAAIATALGAAAGSVGGSNPSIHIHRLSGPGSTKGGAGGGISNLRARIRGATIGP
jgi:hypothetical protein